MCVCVCVHACVCVRVRSYLVRVHTHTQSNVKASEGALHDFIGLVIERERERERERELYMSEYVESHVCSMVNAVKCDFLHMPVCLIVSPCARVCILYTT